MQSLRKSVDEMYAAFAEIGKPTSVDGCPCCIDKVQLDALVKSPLRELSPQQLSTYASKAFLTVGSRDDYLYFLPRILDLSAEGELSWPAIEVTGWAIRSSDPMSWSQSQRHAVQSFFAAVFEEMLQEEMYRGLDSWLCAIGRSGFEIQLYLNRLADEPAALLKYFEANLSTISQRRLSNPFWDLPSDSCAHDEIVAWFYSDPIRRFPFEAWGYEL